VGVEILELSPRLHLVQRPVGQVYVWQDGSELTLIDTGTPGSTGELAAAFADLGFRRADVRRVVLTHCHEDHTGGAAAIREWADVEIMAGAPDAPVIRGDRERAAPVITERERPMFERVMASAVPAAPCPVDTELADGATVPFGGGATIASVPGHTDGSIAIHLPAHGVLFTGDLAANTPGGVILGPFNVDRALAKRSFVAVTALPATTVCFGHGDPLTDGSAWRSLAERCAAGPDAVPDPLG
jgi:glyoxylase-like metal-dependent hydrolase (beta-lactamase superfamily II)